MSFTPRPYQQQLIEETEAAWSLGFQNVMIVLATGGGKSLTLAELVRRRGVPTCIIAHRQELVGQLSMAIARCGLRHGLIAADATVRNIVRMHMDELGRSWYDPNTQIKVASVDTMLRMNPSDPWLKRVGLWVVDEQHHLLATTKWGKAVAMMPNAVGLGVTATPVRADGLGLGRHADGLVDYMVEGPSMRDLIKQGYLCDYRIYCAPSDIDLSAVPTSAGGDYSPEKLREAVKKSHIVGDVVQHYLKVAPGKLGVTFCVSIDAATETCAAYREAGVAAEVLSAKTPDLVRSQVLRRFRNREITQIVNVDLISEGFDMPAIEVVSMARPTQSYSLYCLDPHTEVLTDKGWMGANDALLAETVIAFDMNDGSTKTVPVTDRIARPMYADEHMIAYESDHASICVTDKHDLVTRSMGTAAWGKERARDAALRKAMFRVPVCGSGHFEGSGLTNSDLLFLGWFLSDGCRHKKNNSITISQSSKKQKHLASIESAIIGCGFKYSKYISQRKNVPETHSDLIIFSISMGAPRGRDKHLTGWGRLGKWVDKSLPAVYDTLTRDELLVMLETWNLGDGANETRSMGHTPRTMRISCGDNKRMADRLQALCVQRGLRAKIHRWNEPGKNEWFNVHIKNTEFACIAGTNVADGSVSGKKPYSRSRLSKIEWRPDFVWCLTNPLGTLITRRNGKVVVVGNCQQFGRSLRPMPEKSYAIILDHVGNVLRHGLPDAPRKWSLDRRERKSKSASPSDAVPLRACPECSQPYERVLPACPWCGHEPQPTVRSSPEAVEGDLHQLSPEVLARMRGEVLALESGPKFPLGATMEVVGAIKKRWMQATEARGSLAEAMALWGGKWHEAGDTDRMIQRRFYLAFGVDVLSAQALNRADAEGLEAKVRGVL